MAKNKGNSIMVERKMKMSGEVAAVKATIYSLGTLNSCTFFVDSDVSSKGSTYRYSINSKNPSTGELLGYKIQYFSLYSVDRSGSIVPNG